MKHRYRLPVFVTVLSAVVFGLAMPVDAQIGDSAQVAVQGATVTPDGRLTFAGRGFGASESTTVTVEDDQGNVPAQGLHPWVVLDNYYVPAQSGVGISSADFVPGEAVQVYLNSRLSQPVRCQTVPD